MSINTIKSGNRFWPNLIILSALAVFLTGLAFCQTLNPVVQAEDAVVYYVDAVGGNDANDGLSPATAWKTLAKVSSVTFEPAVQILLKAGSVWNERLSLHGSGTAGNPIVVDMYDTGNKPIINGGGGSGNPSAEPAVLLQNEEYWEINNLFITHTDGSSGYQGDLWAIRVNVTIAGEFHHIYIRNCTIEKANGAVATKTTGGIYVTVESPSSAPAWYNDLKIQNNKIGNVNNKGDVDGVVGGLGIATQSTHGSFNLAANRKPYLNVLISDNTVGPTGRNNMIIRVSDDAVVQHNRLIESSIYQWGHSIFNFNTDNVMVQYNEAYGNTGPASESDRGGFDADWKSKNTKIQYNYSHDNNWGFGIMKKSFNENVVIRYNISENDKVAIYYYGFENSTGLTDAHVYNNTHYVASTLNVAVFRDRTALNTEFFNNIFYFQGSGSWGSKNPYNCTFENNAYFNITPRGTSYITADPQLVNPGTGGQDINWADYPNVLTGYHLQAKSPVIDAGRTVANNGGQDFWGNPLYSGAPDIGAHERPGAAMQGIPEDPLPKAFALHQNYPNPFNPETYIRYELSEASNVQLVIYDMLGRKIRTLVSGDNRAAGFYSVLWDGFNDSGQMVASGMYIYHIRATNSESENVFSKSRKMMMLG